MRIRAVLVLALIGLYTSVKWIHEVNKKAEGDTYGKNILSTQDTTKAMIRPQLWFFNLMSPKPSVRYIREAEENGLKYQIEKLKGTIEHLEDDMIRDNFDQKLFAKENKLKSALQIIRRPKSSVVLYDESGNVIG